MRNQDNKRYLYEATQIICTILDVLIKSTPFKYNFSPTFHTQKEYLHFKSYLLPTSLIL